VPKHLPALAARAAVVATITTAAAFAAVLPSTTMAAAPAAAPAQSVSIPSVFLPQAPAPAVAPVVSTPVAPAALATPAAPGALTLSAMKVALGKIGSPYRWGAAGPNAFDCSGLVKYSFAQMGISLPRTSRAMSRIGTPVSKANLRPGDLVFFYTPVSHVAIYIGGGKVVHASTSSSPVKISNLSAMPFHNARRV
jgi:cell wall-associated NlpC family hydrolase